MKLGNFESQKRIYKFILNTILKYLKELLNKFYYKKIVLCHKLIYLSHICYLSIFFFDIVLIY